jgi:hypothetical protein
MGWERNPERNKRPDCDQPASEYEETMRRVERFKKTDTPRHRLARQMKDDANELALSVTVGDSQAIGGLFVTVTDKATKTLLLSWWTVNGRWKCPLDMTQGTENYPAKVLMIADDKRWQSVNHPDDARECRQPPAAVAANVEE